MKKRSGIKIYTVNEKCTLQSINVVKFSLHYSNEKCFLPHSFPIIIFSFFLPFNVIYIYVYFFFGFSNRRPEFRFPAGKRRLNENRCRKM